MFTNACSAIIVVRPRARNVPKRSGAPSATRRPRQAMTENADQHQRRANQAELFGDHRVDEVGVRLGQVEQLLHAAHQSEAGDTTGADGNE